MVVMEQLLCISHTELELSLVLFTRSWAHPIYGMPQGHLTENRPQL